MKIKVLLLYISAISMLSFISLTEAIDTDYIKLNLDSLYQVEIPKLWKVSGEKGNTVLGRKIGPAFNTLNIKQYDGQNRILFTADAHIGKSSIAFARLSVRTSKKALSQNGLIDMSRSDLQNVAKVMMDKIERNLKSVSKDSTVKLIQVEKKVINGKICISTESEQESNGNSMRHIINIYPLGDRILRMSVAYNQSATKTYKPIADRIVNSLTIE